MLDCPLSGSGSQALLRDVLVYSKRRERRLRSLPASVLRLFQAPHYPRTVRNGSENEVLWPIFWWRSIRRPPERPSQWPQGRS